MRWLRCESSDRRRKSSIPNCYSLVLHNHKLFTLTVAFLATGLKLSLSPILIPDIGICVPTMTFAILRSLHAIIGDALDEMESVYRSNGYSIPNTHNTPENASFMPDKISPRKSLSKPLAAIKAGNKSSGLLFDPYVSPPPSPSTATWTDSDAAESSNMDFPPLDLPYDQTSLSEVLTSHPTVIAAIGRIIAAAGQLSASVQSPFLTLCDVTMGV